MRHRTSRPGAVTGCSLHTQSPLLPADTCHTRADQHQSLNVGPSAAIAVAAVPGREFTAELGSGVLPVCGTIKDEVVTANEPWFGSAAIEQTLGERRDDPSSGAQ
jgi:hypothetical protein